MATKFGIGQIGAETPAFISKLKRALNFFSGGIVTFLPQIAASLHTTTDALAWKIGAFILLVNSLGIMFGVEPDNEAVK